MTERQLQESVVELASVLGWLSYHTFDSRRSAAGFPDLVLVRPPRLLFVELKDAKGERSHAQHVWGEQLERVAAAVARIDEFELASPGPVLVGYRLWQPVDWLAGHVERELRAR